MKRIIGFTYIDRHDVIQYPIREVVASALPLVEKHYVFATEPRLVAKDLSGMKGVEIVRVGFSVEQPLDLAVAQNKCLELLREHGADFTFMLCADDILLSRGAVYLRQRTERSDDRTWNLHVWKRECKFIFGTGTNIHGCWLGGADCVARFIEDGGYTDVRGEENITPSADGPLAIGIGYLGVDRFFRKIRSHAKVWSNPEGDQLVSMLDTGNVEGAIRKALRRVRIYETPHQELVQAAIDLPEYNAYQALAGIGCTETKVLLKLASAVNRESF